MSVPRHSPRVPTLYPDRRTAHPTLVRSPRARYLRNTTRSSNKTIWTYELPEIVRMSSTDVCPPALPRVPTLYPDRRTAHPTRVRSPRARYLRNTTRSSNKTIWTPPPREAVRFFLPISFLRRLGTNRWVTCSLPVMVQLNARTARPAGILEAEFDKYWALEWGELLAALRDETGSARKKRKKHL